jgi:hypothetical protein
VFVGKPIMATFLEEPTQAGNESISDDIAEWVRSMVDVVRGRMGLAPSERAAQ